MYLHSFSATDTRSEQAFVQLSEPFIQPKKKKERKKIPLHPQPEKRDKFWIQTSPSAAGTGLYSRLALSALCAWMHVAYVCVCTRVWTCVCVCVCGPCLHLDVTCVWWMCRMLPCTKAPDCERRPCMWLTVRNETQSNTLTPNKRRLRSSTWEGATAAVPWIETGWAAPEFFFPAAETHAHPSAVTDQKPTCWDDNHMDSIFPPPLKKLSSSHRCGNRGSVWRGTRTCSKHEGMQRERLPVASSLWHVQ